MSEKGRREKIRFKEQKVIVEFISNAPMWYFIIAHYLKVFNVLQYNN